MSSLKVLHLASFLGNMGDQVNHACTRAELAKTFDFSYTNLEIREYYWKQRNWDDLPELANQYDLLMIGGGNFFEAWPATRTSTSIDLPPELMEKIKCPILFYGLGVDTAQGIHDIGKLKRFISYIQESENRLLVVRNDGAKQNLKDLTGFDAMEVADGGFYYKTRNPVYHHMAINLAGDMPEIRYPNGVDAWLDPFCDFLNRKLDQDDTMYIVFIPHIWDDIWIIHKALSKIEDKWRRTRISVAPYNMGDMFHMYHCELTLAMRFHANVCSLALGTPTIALNTYPQIKKLYHGLELDQLANNVDDLERLWSGFTQKFHLPNIRNVHNEIYQWLRNIN